VQVSSWPKVIILTSTNLLADCCQEQLEIVELKEFAVRDDQQADKNDRRNRLIRMVDRDGCSKLNFAGTQPIQAAKAELDFAPEGVKACKPGGWLRLPAFSAAKSITHNGAH